MTSYKKRIEKLQEWVTKQGCDAFIVENSTNLYYLTGLELSAGCLWVQREEARLFVDGRYLEKCQAASPVPVIRHDYTSNTFIPYVEQALKVSSVGFNQDITTYKRYQTLLAELKSVSSRNIQLIPLKDLVLQMRSIKDEEEVIKLKKAGELGSQGFDYICTLLKEGVQEIEIAQELEIFWRQQGNSPSGFKPIIAYGANSSMPHYQSGETSLKKRDAVLVDIGVKRNGYNSDMTRMIYFGTPDPEILTIHHIVQRAQEAALSLCAPGRTVGELDKAARDLITKEGYGEYFVHGLGHGVGLEVHELPILRNASPYAETVLAPGMVITIEPGIYLPGKGGVRLEDTLLITKEGYMDLTNRSKDPLILNT
jgi:Xaa-Pro aminopeptidase